MPPRPAKPPPQVLAQLRECARQIGSGGATAALITLGQIRRLRPHDPGVLVLIGDAHAELGRHAEAIEAYAAAHAAVPDDRNVRRALAGALRRGGRYAEALGHYEALLAFEPGSLELARSRASTLIDLGREDEAADVLERLIEGREARRAPPTERLLLAIAAARVSPRFLRPGPIIEAISALAGDPRCARLARVNAYAQLGRLLEGEGRYDEAFAAFAASNDLDKLPWDPDAHSARIDALIACWRGHRDIPSAAAEGSRMVFIVGMMRSGTTLTEQMVAMGEGVTPGGELNAISRQVATVEAPPRPHARPMPVTPARYTGPVIERMRRGADEVYARFNAPGRLTDKQPTNYLYVPLIARLYPGAKVIHCVRDAQDTCLSCYCQAFTRPHPFAQDLHALGRYHRDYQRLMDAWRDLGDAPMLDLRYEDLVADPEAQSRRVFEFLGLEWTPRVLDFHQSDRAAATASRQQVRQPIYTRSVARHERYAAHLGPLREGLGIA